MCLSLEKVPEFFKLVNEWNYRFRIFLIFRYKPYYESLRIPFSSSTNILMSYTELLNFIDEDRRNYYGVFSLS